MKEVGFFITDDSSRMAESELIEILRGNISESACEDDDFAEHINLTKVDAIMDSGLYPCI